MADGRIDELRKRLDKEPGSRLFAQLAEELRKTGELAEAIQVSRQGLQKHPTYHSARMTLARALLDTGDLNAARPEFEAVLKGAPDNILASRLLGECLEGLGDLAAARARYKTTLALAPGDKQVQAHLDAVDARLAAPSQAPPPVAASAPVAAPAVTAEPAPIPLVAADESFELEQAYEAPAIRVVEAPLEAPAPAISLSAPVAAPAPAMPAPVVVPEPEPEFVDFEAEARRQTTAPIEVVSRVPLVDLEPEPVPGAMAAPALPVPPEAGAAELASPTLGELYYSQGHTDKAVEVYRQILVREPDNGRASARLAELEGLGSKAPSATTGDRREAIRRTIGRLEGLLAAVRRG